MRVRMHEVPELAVAVEILEIGIDDVGGFERIGRLHRELDRAAGLEVSVFDARERLALARLTYSVSTIVHG
jgi:hypothetical protein